jgi:hypothetical protein
MLSNAVLAVMGIHCIDGHLHYYQLKLPWQFIVFYIWHSNQILAVWEKYSHGGKK